MKVASTLLDSSEMPQVGGIQLGASNLGLRGAEFQARGFGIWQGVRLFGSREVELPAYSCDCLLG